ncbi:MAG: hypothetical protein WC477_03880 [Patescibacteria group bacterium]
MRLFEHIPELFSDPQTPLQERVDDPDISKAEIAFFALQKSLDQRRKDGYEIHPHEVLAEKLAMRNVLLERLSTLEALKEQRKKVSKDSFDTLRFMLSQGYLKGEGGADAESFLETNEMREQALEFLEMLKQTDDEIGIFEEAEGGMTPEELATHAEVRRRHWEVAASAWSEV